MENQAQRYLAGIYLLLAFSILSLAASFLSFGIRPLTEQLHAEHDQNLQQFLDSHTQRLEAMLDADFDLCRQAASFTTARHALQDYLGGRMNLQRLRAITQPRLLDLLRYNAGLEGLTRFSAGLQKIVEVGTPVDPSYYLPHLPSGNVIERRGPLTLPDKRRYMLYYSPILQEGSGTLGYDLLLMDSERIQDLVDTPYASFGNLFVVRNDHILYAPAEAVSQIPRHVVQSYVQGQLVSDHYMVKHRQVPDADWELYLVVDQRQSLGRIRQSVRHLVYIVSGTTVLIFIITLFVLRPVIRALISHGQLYELSYRDGLTGLYNHRHFQRVMDQELSRAHRYGNPLSVLMLDIDHFKSINDTHGHQCGDEVLRTVSRVVNATVRATDIAARYGGEEFAIVLPETDNPSAQRMAERLRQDMELSETPARNLRLHVTVSIGLVTYDPRISLKQKSEIIEAADRALYASKRGGRNRITDAGAWQEDGIDRAVLPSSE